MKKLKSHKTFNGLTSFWSHESFVTKTEMKFASFIPEGKNKRMSHLAFRSDMQ